MHQNYCPLNPLRPALLLTVPVAMASLDGLQAHCPAVPRCNDVSQGSKDDRVQQMRLVITDLRAFSVIG